MNCFQEEAGPISPHSPPYARVLIDSLCGVGWLSVRPIQEATARSDV